jgi:hypothetical protein
VLTSLLDAWSSLYSNHATLRTLIEFAHIGGLVAGGGCAITADLATMTAAREAAASQRTELRLLKRTHAIVVLGLVLLFASGALLFAADVGTYLYSKVFWLKMALIVLLLINGALLLRGEREVQRGAPGAWARLNIIAVVSLVLWFLTTLAGAALPNIG